MPATLNFSRRTSAVLMWFGLLAMSPIVCVAATIETVAGGGSDDGNAAIAVALNRPAGMASDAAGNIYVAEYSGNRIRKVAAGTGIVSTVAGGLAGYGGDGGAATAARLNYPHGIAVDQAGNLYIADSGNNRIRKVTAATGIITTIAGTNSSGYDGDGPDATVLRISGPAGIAVDTAGNVYFSDTNNQRIRKITPAGALVTVAGDGTQGFGGDGGNALSASFHTPNDIAMDAGGNLYIADYWNHRIRRIDAASRNIDTVAGDGTPGFTGDGGPAISARFNGPMGLAVDAEGNLYFGDYYNARMRKITMASGAVTTVAGNGTATFAGDGGSATAASLSQPYGVTVDNAGDLLISDAGNLRIRRVVAGIISTFAGNGQAVYTGDGGNALAASLYNPRKVALDATGNLYIADTYHQRIRKVDAATKIISTVAGTGTAGASGDGGPATAADLSYPEGLAIDAVGNLHISDASNGRIRKIAAGTNIISTEAGTTSGFSGDGGPAAAAQLSYPGRLTLSPTGDIYIVDGGNRRIRKISATTGNISTVAGNGTAASTGDGGGAIDAGLYAPTSVALDATGNLYIPEYQGGRVRKVDATTQFISTVAGNGSYGYSGDGGPATAASFMVMEDVVVDSIDNLYIADCGNHRIRKVAAGIVTTVAGTGTAGVSGDGGPATSADIDCPYGLALNASGTLLYFADTNRDRIRRFPIGDFGDVPFSNWAFNYIHAIATAGITTGCGNLNYCPSQNVTREQMAAFIVRAKEGEPASACASAPFADVSISNGFCKYIKRMLDLNITTGCGGGNYCPTGNVDRQQMAAFIIRALEGNPIAGYCGDTAPFGDVPTNSTFCGHIKRMAELGITTGCGNGNYCPTQSVTRDQMAAFLGRAFLGM